MAEDGSVAPKERINIVYRPATDMEEDVELPFKMMVIGDFTGRADDTPLEERKRVSVDKDNFNDVLAEQGIEMSFGVADKLRPDAEEGDEIPVSIKVDSMKSFEPEQVVAQVPELRSLLEVRDALVALKGPLGNVKAFSKKLKETLADDAARDRLLKELGMAGDGSDAGGSAETEGAGSAEAEGGGGDAPDETS